MANSQLSPQVAEWLAQLPDWATVIDGIARWQTLITGLVAIVAALIGARAINRQIRHAEEMEYRRKASRFLATISTFDRTIADIKDYLYKLLELWKFIYEKSIERGEIYYDIDLIAHGIEFPKNTLIVLQDLIEHIPVKIDNNIINMYRNIIGIEFNVKYKIENLKRSNYREKYLGNSVYSSNQILISKMIECLRILIYVDKIESYFKNIEGSEIKKIEWIDVKRKASCTIDSIFYKDICDQIEKFENERMKAGDPL